MDSWCLFVREEGKGWKWTCYDTAGSILCWSDRCFPRLHLAVRDFELRREDHEAMMAHRYPAR